MIAAFAGGVGGAKMAHGLMSALPPGQLTVIVNTADDFDLFGLRICPDLDTVLYTLGGLANPVFGWGIAGDTRNTLAAIGRYGRELWFQLGDQDFATHILRTERLRAGASLSEVTDEFVAALGIPARLIPMTNEPVATFVETPGGLLDFQTYFVGHQQADEVTGLQFRGVDKAEPHPAAIEAIASADLLILCPSNPLVSIGPILAVPGYREVLAGRHAPLIAVSPIIGGKALKGPADRMMVSLGHEASALGVAKLYRELLDGIVIDQVDSDHAAAIERLGIRALVTQAVMADVPDRERLAQEVLEFGKALQVAGAAR